MTNAPQLMAGTRPIETPSAAVRRFALLLWGSSGCGKTTLAATAPGTKLWISFDPDGTACLANRDDVLVIDLANVSDSITQTFKEKDPLRLAKVLDDRPDIETIVFDSVTSFGDKALAHGVIVAQGTKKGARATIEQPGYDGYGNKNTWVRYAIINLLELTHKRDLNVIFIAHEDKPDKDINGIVMSISIMLGSALLVQVPIKLSEIWAMEDTGKERRIAVRPCRFRRPMKTRMFVTNKSPEFTWIYDADTDIGMTIASLYKAWKDGDFKKLEIPN